MEGFLLIPPDRGTIIGRAVWKTRYVVVGSPQRDGSQPNLSLSQVLSAKSIKEARGQVSKPKPLPDAIYLSIYKSKDDWEAVQQHSISSITDCTVQMIAHRKQGPVLPTLILQVSPDPATDKLRKRRSSRTAGLTTTKEFGPTTLHFRPGDDTYSLNDWARYISSLIQPGVPERAPMSPITPMSPTFINPFATAQPRDASEYTMRPSSSKQNTARPQMQHTQSSQSRSSRERPVTFSSESPSLRSRRSDISSHASSVNAMGMGYVLHGQHYTTVLPTDLPSPAATVGEFQGEYMLGWTSAQGRSSVLSSPTRTRGSVSSQGQQGAQLSSSPPFPRETILDRAFQMRYIPGSDRDVPGEEKLSSLARFDALMREAEERRRKERQDQALASPPMTSTWEEDEDSDDDDLNDEVDEDESTDDDAFEEEATGERTGMGPSAQRALHYISNPHRHSAIAPGGRTSLSFHAGMTAADGSSILRPHTAHSKPRPVMSPRTSSQPQVPLEMAAAPIREESISRPHHEKRHSTSSVKRLSFNDFTKRLSSTSSLLLVQTNASSGSRGSSEYEAPQQTTPRNGMNPRSIPPPRSPQDQEKCGWRGSVGVFGGGEGGFL
ncbi:hypothetical protein JX265_003905 [Neoarthrinium moseri]|uniref:Uncharacterized protein n=1 Tax=Neoarthrinium moseri TaxID=1658444 RepID=A0A9P9WRD7_9PEZI|nr:uncharacterized protein JN550_009469 [Neoarthrinium moseri]KAI1853761.1 hypothetical protein JX266_001745 [Neoarthrinium moseri]KAI1863769.1 hypothetical protein JN550_009469 [Neoarthrinium moseri]KAI1876379.1 hypothetical protein JX265_003905 [Neoarthrinium moseri]